MKTYYSFWQYFFLSFTAFAQQTQILKINLLSRWREVFTPMMQLSRILLQPLSNSTPWSCWKQVWKILPTSCLWEYKIIHDLHLGLSRWKNLEILCGPNWNVTPEWKKALRRSHVTRPLVKKCDQTLCVLAATFEWTTQAVRVGVIKWEVIIYLRERFQIFRLDSEIILKPLLRSKV